MKIKDATLLVIITTFLLLIERLIAFVRYLDGPLKIYDYIYFGIHILFPIGLIIFFIVIYNKQK